MKKAAHPAVVVRKGPESHNILQTADIPPRSRLYGLEPYQVNTIWSESLTRWDPLESTCRHASLSIL